MSKIAITTTSFGKYNRKPLELLENDGYEVVFNSYGRTLKRDEIIEFCKDAVGIIAGTETFDTEVLEKLSQSSVLSPQSCLKVISRCGTGLDNVDMKAAERLGIKVFNTPDAPTLAVAELTLGLMLSLLRKINQADSSIRRGVWEKPMGNLLCGKNVGIIGFGRIGQKVAELLMPFGCEIAYYDIGTEGEGLRTEFEELLKISDIISIHISSKEQIIGETEIRFMKKGAWLVNVARGGVVDENALYRALKEGHLAGAALDVFELEPYTGPLPELNNVLLTPHIGSYAKETRIRMEIEGVENLIRGLSGKD